MRDIYVTYLIELTHKKTNEVYHKIGYTKYSIAYRLSCNRKAYLDNWTDPDTGRLERDRYNTYILETFNHTATVLEIEGTYTEAAALEDRYKSIMKENLEGYKGPEKFSGKTEVFFV